MRVSIPERTVDAWVAIALARKFKNAPIWLPTNQGVDDWDLVFGPGPQTGKLVILENKSATPIARGPGDHRIAINRSQLARYCQNSDLNLRTFYVLPSPPWADAPAPVVLPPQSMERDTADQWLHVVAAPDLDAYLGAKRKSLRASEMHHLPSRSLAVFFEELHQCEWSRTWVQDLYGESLDRWFTGPEEGAAEDLSLFRVERERRRDGVATTLSPVTALIPPEDLSSAAQARLARP